MQLSTEYRQVEVAGDLAPGRIGVCRVDQDDLVFRPVSAVPENIRNEAQRVHFDVYNSNGRKLIGHLSVTRGLDGRIDDRWRLLERSDHGIRISSHPVAEPADSIAAAVRSALRSAALSHRANTELIDDPRYWEPSDYRPAARAAVND